MLLICGILQMNSEVRLKPAKPQALHVQDQPADPATVVQQESG
jgi:hypothetical protein